MQLKSRSLRSVCSSSYAVTQRHRSSETSAFAGSRNHSASQLLQKDSLHAEEGLQPGSQLWWLVQMWTFLLPSKDTRTVASRDGEDAAPGNKLICKHFQVNLSTGNCFNHDFSQSWADESRHLFYRLLLLDDIKSWVKKKPQPLFILLGETPNDAR